MKYGKINIKNIKNQMISKYKILEAINIGIFNALNEDKSYDQAKHRLRTICNNMSDIEFNDFYKELIEWGWHNDKRIAVKFIPVIGKLFKEMLNDSAYAKSYINPYKQEKIRKIFIYISSQPNADKCKWTDFINMTYEQLLNEYEDKIIKSQKEKEKHLKTSSYAFNNEYDIIEIPTFKKAHEIGQYSGDESMEGTPLCFARYKNYWDEFTNFGRNRVYCCLRKNWKDVPCKKGPNAPYDNYGLSMIFVFIDYDGEIAYSNTRWNHMYAKSDISVDQAFSNPKNKKYNEEFLNQLIGCNYKDVMHPFERPNVNVLIEKYGQNPKPKTKKQLYDIIYDYMETFGYDIDLNFIDTSLVSDMSYLFYDFKDEFNGKIDKWDVSNVKNMSYMFIHCKNFNQPLNSWNVSKVKAMNGMFQDCEKFNQPLNNWNISNVKQCAYMFKNCIKFNQDLSMWDMHKKYHIEMFDYANKMKTNNLPKNI